MAEERVVETRTPADGTSGPVVATTARTGEGDVYYTGPRPIVESGPRPIIERTVTVSPTYAVVRDRVRWASVLAGLVAALTTFALLELLGVAIGFSIFNTGSDTSTISATMAIWSGVSAFLAFLIGGWVAGRTAGVVTLSNILLNSFLVGAAAVVLLFWMVGASAGNLFGIIGGSAGGIIHTAISNPAALQNAMTDASSIVNNASFTPAQVQSAARDSAWFTFGAILIGLIASTLGGWFGYVSRHGYEVETHG